VGHDHCSYLLFILFRNLNFVGFRPFYLKHRRFLLLEKNAVFPLSAPLGMKMRRIVVVRRELKGYAVDGKRFYF